MESIAVYAPCNVSTIDEPDHKAGNACHLYAIQYGGPDDVCKVQFQHGARGAPGATPGVFDDALLAIEEHRMAAFQTGPFACEENERALDAIRTARRALADRVAARQAAGVLGANKEH